MVTKTFDWDGETFTLFENADKWTLGETRAIERWLGHNLNELMSQEQTMAVLAVSIRRQRPDLKLSSILTAVEDMEQGVLLDMMNRVQEAEEAERQAAEVEGNGAPDPSEAADGAAGSESDSAPSPTPTT